MNKNNFAIFDKNNLGGVRTVNDKNGKCWYAATDVCKCLELKNVSRACEIMFHDEIDIKPIDSESHPLTVLSEEAVFLLIMRSNKNEARRFQQYVIHEILPNCFMKNNQYTFF